MAKAYSAIPCVDIYAKFFMQLLCKLRKLILQLLSAFDNRFLLYERILVCSCLDLATVYKQILLLQISLL